MSKAQYDDGLASLYLADARSMDFIEDRSVDCIVTSPPYWSLRKYPGGAEMVWDAAKGCEHVWGAGGKHVVGRADKLNSSSSGIYSEDSAKWKGEKRDASSGQFCQLCGAWRGQLGLEPTIELYLDHLLQILDTECKRVLKDTGVMWINVGDSYATGGKSTQDGMQPVTWSEDGKAKKRGMTRAGTPAGLKPLDRCTIPWRFAMAMRERGWYLRREIVWVKPNPMPESPNGWRWEQHRVTECPNCGALASFRKRACKECGWKKGTGENVGTIPAKQDSHRGADALPEGRHGVGIAQYIDCPGCPKCLPNDGLVLRKGNWRPTTSHEWIFMLTKTNSYYCDADAVREVHKEPWRSEPKNSYIESHGQKERQGLAGMFEEKRHRQYNPAGRNLRSVWHFPTQSYKEAHFATFPMELPTRCIKASTSERGNCPKCGMPWARVIHRDRPEGAGGPNPEGKYAEVKPRSLTTIFTEALASTSTTLGWRPSCGCDAGDPVPALCLDPFTGSGTTNAAATKLGRASIGVDCVEEYLKMAIKRIQEAQVAVQEANRDAGREFTVKVEGVKVKQTGLFQ